MEATNADLQQLRVLVVDDNMDAADGLATLLEVMGCQTAIAYDGSQGIAAATVLKPHLGFIDLEMPGMNGREVVRQLRSTDSARRMRLVCVTGRASDQDRQLCLEAGFDDFITKPMTPEALAQQVAASRSDF